MSRNIFGFCLQEKNITYTGTPLKVIAMPIPVSIGLAIIGTIRINKVARMNTKGKSRFTLIGRSHSGCFFLKTGKHTTASPMLAQVPNPV